MGYFYKKNVLVTGSCGTIGQGLIKKLLQTDVSKVIGIDNNETGLFFQKQLFGSNENFRAYYCDIVDPDSTRKLIEGVDVVIHAAALKHVTICEDSPVAAIRNNVVGTQNIIDACLANDVERMTFTSSDKAVNPTNVMGTTKLLGEKLITAAAHMNTATIFSSTRFGNVLGSSGSVIPIFRQQLKLGVPLTVTHPDMTRFVMTEDEACELVLKSVFEANTGETLVTKMRVMKIMDLALAMHQQIYPETKKPEINVVGTKPGEKLYEELTTSEEIRRTTGSGDYLRISSPFQYFPVGETSEQTLDREYISSNELPMSVDEIKNYLLNNGLS